MRRRAYRLAGAVAIGLCAALAPDARAAGMLTEVSGAVRVSSAGKAPVAAARGRAIEPGTTIATGAGARAAVKFDDGGRVELDQNTELELSDYAYDSRDPYVDYERLQLSAGSVRVVTGLIAGTGPGHFVLHTPAGDVVTEEADFGAASGSLYLAVLQGKVTAINDGRLATFGVGQYGFAEGISAPVAIDADKLPENVAASFSRLGTVAAGSGGAASGAGGATGAVANNPALVRGLVAAGVAAVLVSIGSSTTTTHH